MREEMGTLRKIGIFSLLILAYAFLALAELQKMPMLFGGAYLSFFLAAWAFCGSSKRLNRFRLVFPLILSFAFTFFYRVESKHLTNSTLSSFFETENACTYLALRWRGNENKYVEDLGEEVCFISSLKEKISHLSPEVQSEKIRQATDLLKKENRLKTSGIVLLMAVNINARAKQRKPLKDRVAKEQLDLSLLQDQLYFAEMLPPNFYETDQKEFGNYIAKIDQQMVRPLLLTVLSTSKVNVTRLKKQREGRQPAEAKQIEECQALSARIQALQEAWHISDDEIKSFNIHKSS